MAELPFLLNNSMENRPKNHLESVAGVQVKWSLPCNVNSGESATSIQFLEEAKRTKAMKDKDFTAIDMETANLLDNDHLAQSYEDQQQQSIEMTTLGGPKYTSKATLQISRANVDDAISMRDLEDSSLESKKTIDYSTLTAKVINSRHQVIYPISSSTATYGTMRTIADEKRSLDENGNALGHQTQSKKKKKVQSERNVNVMLAESIQGYKGKEDVEDLLNYIEGIDGSVSAAGGKSKSLPKSKQLHKQHTTDEGGVKCGKKQKKGSKDSAGAGGDTGSRTELKKSNSLSEISGMKLDSEFVGSISSSANSERSSSVKGDEREEKVVMRVKKDSGDRLRERRSWGNVELSSFQPIYNTSSLENIETSAENWVVTRPKKKSKKRRNSVSSAGGRLRPDLSRSNTRPSGSLDGHNNNRALSPDLRADIVVGGNSKMTRSMPHSEKSNDSSSDVDSVHSLPMDGPISYADIAKNMEKKKTSPEKPSERIASNQTPNNTKEKSPQPSKPQYVDPEPRAPVNVTEKTNSATSNTQITPTPPIVSKNVVPDVNSIKSFPAITTENNNKHLPPDVHNIKSFPAITGSLSKTTTVQTSVIINNPLTANSDKAVQSTISYEEMPRDRTPAQSKSGVVSGVAGVSVSLNSKSGVATNTGVNAPVTSKSVVVSNPGGANAKPGVVSNVGGANTVVSSKSSVASNAGVVNVSVSNPRIVSSTPTVKKQTSPSPSSGKVSRSGKDVNRGSVTPQKGETASEAVVVRQEVQKQQSSSDIKTELSFFSQFIQANETNPGCMSFTQKLPPDVPDVATIEKLQFMSMSPPLSASPQQESPSMVVQNQQAVNSQSPPNSQQVQQPRNQKRSRNRIEQQQQSEKNQQLHAKSSRQSSPPKSSDTSYCDSSKNDELTCSSHLVNGVLEEPSQPEPSPSPPAVIILSGSGKEAPHDLVFGFDINEQLLQEDAEGEPPTVQDSGGGGSVDYVDRFIMPPKESTPSAQNLEKIVHYIGSAWEQIISSQRVQYYSDDL